MAKRRFRRGGVAIEYGLVAILLGITTLSLGSVGTSLTPMYETAPCVATGKDPKKCGLPRTGATCRDGTSSKAKGRGACSRHGGVKHWNY